MDNLTHTLIGLVAGEAVARCARPHSSGLAGPTRRTTLLVMGMVGGNLPDLDLLWSMPALTGDPLAYLVEHRGYTHTIVGCAALAMLLFAGALGCLRWRGHRLRASEIGLFGAMALLAVMLHLGMDALNEYGVHPFWPWNNRWYYGDSVFIVEPLCWLAVAPLLAGMRARAARVVLGCVLLLGCVAVLAFHRFGIAWWSLPVFALVLVAVGRRVSPRSAALAAVALMVSVVGVFATAHAAVMQRVTTLAAQQFAGATTLDIVLSPAPAHPLCWDVMLLQREGNDYVARIGQLALATSSGQPCSRNINAGGTAPLRGMNRPVHSGMVWMGEYTMDVEALARLATGSCDARRLASFLRAPFAARSSDGWILGDLRYDREQGPGFAELLVVPQANTPCRASPWIAPRRDLGFQHSAPTEIGARRR